MISRYDNGITALPRHLPVFTATGTSNLRVHVDVVWLNITNVIQGGENFAR